MRFTIASSSLVFALLSCMAVEAENTGITQFCRNRATNDCANVPNPFANVQHGWTARFNQCRCLEWYFAPAHQSCVEGCKIDYMNGVNPVSDADANTTCHRLCDPNPTCRDPGPCR
ncbi:hypothetical protein V8E36_004422 [Tilletia maclaganii]